MSRSKVAAEQELRDFVEDLHPFPQGQGLEPACLLLQRLVRDFMGHL